MAYNSTRYFLAGFVLFLFFFKKKENSGTWLLLAEKLEKMQQNLFLITVISEKLTEACTYET